MKIIKLKMVNQKLLVRIRHRQPLQKANIKVVENTIYIKFEKKKEESPKVNSQLGTKNELIGSGPID